MIKVNLLRDQTVRTKRAVAMPEVSRTGLMLTAGFVLLAGGLGGSWYYLDRQVEILTSRRVRLEKQSADLEQLKKQVDNFEKLKKLRQSRIEVIERLKEYQTGPVRLLNHVIHALPREGTIWLTILNQTGDRVQIGGYAARSEAIPGFLSSLSGSGMFKTVDLELIEEEKAGARFALLCTLLRKAPTE